MTVATKTLLEVVVRCVKGLTNAFEDWLKAQP